MESQSPLIPQCFIEATLPILIAINWVLSRYARMFRCRGQPGGLVTFLNG